MSEQYGSGAFDLSSDGTGASKDQHTDSERRPSWRGRDSESSNIREHQDTENGGNLLCGLGTMIKNKTGGSLALQSHSSLRLWVRRNDTEHPCILVYPVFTSLCTDAHGDQVFVFVC
jgi:hypothetical protein